MTGADNPDEIWKPSKVFKRLEKLGKKKNMRKPRKIPEGFEWDPKAKELIDTRCNNPKLKKLCRESVKVDFSKSIHCHPAWFGSELACKECNPICYKNHQNGNLNHLKPCSNINCPLNPKRPEKSLGLREPAICISPFFTGTKKLAVTAIITKPFGKKKELPWEHYPHIPILTTNARLRRSLLGLRLQWTIKEDGENVTIWKRKKPHTRKQFEFVISSHNQEIAAKDIQARVRKDCVEDYEKIVTLIEANPAFRIIAEECAKGASVTGIRRYEKPILFVVDIYDTTLKNFLPYTQVYQYCYHSKIPIVQLYASTRHRTIKDLIKFSNHILEYCNTEKDYGKDEGMVLKTFDKEGEYIQAKVKLDIPKPIVERIREGPPQLPQIPESEIMGAISHVEADFGLDGTPKHDMPLIAKAVSEECRKHLYSSRGNLFTFYEDYMERRKK